MKTTEQLEAEYIESVLERSGPPYRCGKCGREIQRGEIMVSLMGNGISCSDWEKCRLAVLENSSAE